jgi:hypothetical protein
MNDDPIKLLRKQIEQLNASVAKISGNSAVPTFGEFAGAYLQEKLRRPLREATKRSFENQVRLHLVPGLGGLFIDKVTNAIWLEWVSKERAKDGRHLSRFFNARKSLVEILRAAKEAGHIEKLPKLDDVDETKAVGRVIEQEQLFREG